LLKKKEKEKKRKRKNRLTWKNRNKDVGKVAKKHTWGDTYGGVHEFALEVLSVFGAGLGS
jgi:hypothetical protein